MATALRFWLWRRLLTKNNIKGAFIHTVTHQTENLIIRTHFSPLYWLVISVRSTGSWNFFDICDCTHSVQRVFVKEWKSERHNLKEISHHKFPSKLIVISYNTTFIWHRRIFLWPSVMVFCWPAAPSVSDLQTFKTQSVVM